uniref:Uncharacterized protein n=1 Tax=Caenorhabditis japonica TaxID=281687 RepID=A0A8R1E2A0_CAEJA
MNSTAHASDTPKIDEKPSEQDVEKEVKEGKVEKRKNCQKTENSEFSTVKRKKYEDPNRKVDPLDELPMKVPFRIVDGIRHLSPYWACYRTRTKGRWIDRKMVDVFAGEFLSTNRNYAKNLENEAFLD